MENIDLAGLIISLAVLLVSLTFHEAAHAWSADRLGDPTARTLGRVSLNPVVHIDPIGTIVFPLIAMITNFPIIGWAKPVPVSPANLEPHWKRKFMVIAAAGPASNLIMAGIGAAVVGAAGFEAAASQWLQIVLFFVRMNVFLAVFNMLPVPPLDGGNVLAGLLRGRASDLFDSLRPWGFLILYGLLFLGVFDALVFPVADAIVDWLL